MKICTFALSSGENIVIKKSMNVVQWHVLCESVAGTCTITGAGTVLTVAGTAITNEAIVMSSGQGFNSIPSPPGSPWDGVTIICTAGSMNVILTTD